MQLTTYKQIPIQVIQPPPGVSQCQLRGVAGKPPALVMSLQHVRSGSVGRVSWDRAILLAPVSEPGKKQVWGLGGGSGYSISKIIKTNSCC